MTMHLSRIHYPVTTLGPGNRIGIWFQGCSIRCPGCVSVDTWATGKGGIEIDDVISTISTWFPEADGITISGGEPFDQKEALKTLLSKIRERTAVDILVFSGHPYEKIQADIIELNGLIDALITDPYEEKTAQTLALRGSDNQRLHHLTELGKSRFSQYNRPLQPSDKTFDIMFEQEGTVWLAGIPLRNDIKRLSSILAKDGHVAITSQDKRQNISETS